MHIFSQPIIVPKEKRFAKARLLCETILKKPKRYAISIAMSLAGICNFSACDSGSVVPSHRSSFNDGLRIELEHADQEQDRRFEKISENRDADAFEPDARVDSVDLRDGKEQQLENFELRSDLGIELLDQSEQGFERDSLFEDERLVGENDGIAVESNERMHYEEENNYDPYAPENWVPGDSSTYTEFANARDSFEECEENNISGCDVFRAVHQICMDHNIPSHVIGNSELFAMNGDLNAFDDLCRISADASYVYYGLITNINKLRVIDLPLPGRSQIIGDQYIIACQAGSAAASNDNYWIDHRNCAGGKWYAGRFYVRAKFVSKEEYDEAYNSANP